MMGFYRIAFLGGKPGTFINSSRLQGYQNALLARGIPYEEDLVLSRDFSIEAGERMMKELIQKDPEVEAVVSVNNLVFLGAMKALNEYGSDAQANIMMAAFDIARHCGLFYRPMISATQNLRAITEKGVSILLNVVNSQTIPEGPITLPVQIEKYHL